MSRRSSLAAAISAAATIGAATIAAALLAPWASAAAQGPAPAAARAQPAPPLGAGPRTVSGRVVMPVPNGERGVPGVMVTLHRVGSDAAGPVDSLRAGAGGRYGFDYQPTGSEDALYFVSASFGGIAYFGPPLRAASVSGDDATITVFDTTSGPVALRVNGRHLIVSASDPGEEREVVEVFELTNDSTVTRVAGGRDSATFRVALPPRATQFAGGQGDVSADAMRLVNGRVEVYAPIAPGILQLSFTYRLPREGFPLSIPLDTATELMEVLLEDSTGSVEGARLVRQGPVESSNRHFVRWVSEDVPDNAVVRVDFPAPARARRVPQFVVVAAGLATVMLLALRYVARRRGPVGNAGDAGVTPERLAQRIASLDAAFERRRAPSEEERATYGAERERLKAELTAALARRDERA